jgi:signal transduction histidine kinase
MTMGQEDRAQRLRKWVPGLLLLLCLIGARSAHAELKFLRHAQLCTAHESSNAVKLPHFVHQPQSGLHHIHWTLSLPQTAHTQRLPALLLPQPVQGLTVKVGDQIIYSLPASTPDHLYHWYRPVLIALPHVLLEGSSPTLIHFEQTGHLRGWYVAPVLQGELNDLQPWHDRLLLLSNTLPTTVNLLSVLVGLFVLAIGWRTRATTYIFGGLTTVVWGILFSLALTPELPVEIWFAWRLMLYACTGNLIYVVLRFLAAIFRLPVSTRTQWPLFLTLQLGWVVFALVGPRAEPLLDVLWTGVAVALYILGSLFLLSWGLRQREYSKLLLLGLHGALTAVLAWHDYGLQSGELPTNWLESWPSMWHAVVLQPIYLTHLSLPVFVVISLWLLVQDHLRHQREQSQHEHALLAQRERITRDIHDGVGARLNLMLWRTRTAPLVTTQLQDELERSIEELRFAINPSQAAPQTLVDALRSLCQRSARWGQPLGIEVQYDEPSCLATITPEKGLHLYKAAVEGLSNALRHSQASQIRVQLTCDEHGIGLTIEDNGQGIPGWDDWDGTKDGVRTTAMGLRGMRHRMQALGGDCVIKTSTRGTRLTFYVPNG